jgi:2-methylcitrate dehydratase PrpD
MRARLRHLSSKGQNVTNGEAPSLADELIDFALTFSADDIPERTLEWAALRFVDTVGVGLACASYDLGTAAAHLAVGDPALGPASVWASGGLRVRVGDACLANGMLSHGMDYDDTHTTATLHPSCVIVPTALAVGEASGASGAEVLAAAVVGYEVVARLGLLASGQFQNRGFHPTSVLGVFGAVAVVSRLMGVSRAVGMNAAGLAGSMASGLMEYLSDGSSAKQMHPGWAAQAAVTAVRLAEHGATGPARVLEGAAGVFRSFAGIDIGGSDVFKTLGEEWLGTLVATKPYPACHCVHAPVDAWRALSDRLALSAEEIAGISSITGLVPSWYLQLVCDPMAAKRTPRSVYEARFSLPYSIGVAVVDGKLDLSSYDVERLADPRVLAVAAKVDYEVLEYSEFPEAFPGGVRVTWPDGRVEEEHVLHNLGSVGNPMSPAEICEKFLGAASRLTGPDKAGRILTSLRSLSQASSLGEYTQAIAEVAAAPLLSRPSGDDRQ